MRACRSADRTSISQTVAAPSCRSGGLPTRAQLRLAEEAGPNRKLFTSDLSVNEFLLASEIEHAQPISQVMGSARIYHIGKIADYKGATGEITSISDAHREVAPARALAPATSKRRPVDADAVIGVRLERAPRSRWARTARAATTATRSSSSPSSAPRCARRGSRTRKGKPDPHRSLGPGSVGARARRLRAVRFPVRLLPLPRVARDEAAADWSGGEVDGARARRSTTARASSVATRHRRRRARSAPSSSSAPTSRSTCRRCRAARRAASSTTSTSTSAGSAPACGASRACKPPAHANDPAADPRR